MKRYVILTKEELKLLEPFEAELTGEELNQYLYSKGFYSKTFFTLYFLEPFGYVFEEEIKGVPDHFRKIRYALDHNKRQVLIEPRGHGKTTAILIWILRSLVYGTERSIMYLASAELGSKGVGKIRGELETNERILQVFGNLVPANSDNPRDKRLKRWNDKQIELLNGCFLASFSKRKSLRGQRFKKIIVDDPQEDKDVQKIETVKKFNAFFLKTVVGMLMPSGSICVIGTVISQNCLVLFLSVEKKRSTIRDEACDKNFENLLWPEVWSKESLYAQMLDMGTAIFNQEYRHIPISSEDAPIEEKRIRYFEGKPKRFDFIVQGVDPKSSLKNKGDYAGFCVIGAKILTTDVVKYYVLYSTSKKISPGQQQTVMMKLSDHFKCDEISKEDNIEQGITENVKAKGYNIRGVHTSRDKMTRLYAQAGKIEFGNVLFGENQENLIYQLTHFPDTEYDDEMDAFLLALKRAYEKVGKAAKIRSVSTR